jgi:hypothetical protein
LREIGLSRVAYFPGDVDSTFWEILDPDHGRTIANVTRWALGEPDVVSVAGQGVLDVSAWQGDDFIAVHLVNLTNPMMMKGPLRETIATGPQQLSVRLPQGKSPRQTRLLVSQAEVKPSFADQTLRLTIPSITDHEVVAVILEMA